VAVQGDAGHRAQTGLSSRGDLSIRKLSEIKLTFELCSW
jgi:hypothetical protein